MTERSPTLRAVAKRALEFRLGNGVAFEDPCDIYELICRRGLELQFVDIPSLEGMYLEEPETQRICICAHRPAGRQRYTAAHELAHHLLGHGTQLDAVMPDLGQLRGLSSEEIAADTFARYALMPPRAVQAAFRLRSCDPAAPDPTQVYRAACWLGVGYATLLNQILYSLNLLGRARYRQLSKVTPKRIKIKLAGFVPQGDVWPLDEFWANKRLHAQVGDLILGLKSTCSGSLLTRTHQGGFTATEVGEAVVPLEAGGSVRVSVSRAAYIGFYDYRYLPE